MNEKVMKATVWNIAKTQEKCLEDILNMECPLDKKIVLLCRIIEQTNNGLYIVAGETVDGLRQPPGTQEQCDKQKEAEEKIAEIQKKLKTKDPIPLTLKDEVVKEEEEVEEEEVEEEEVEEEKPKRKTRKTRRSVKVEDDDDDEEEEEEVVESEGDDDDDDEEESPRRTRRKRRVKRKKDED